MSILADLRILGLPESDYGRYAVIGDRLLVWNGRKLLCRGFSTLEADALNRFRLPADDAGE